MHEYKITREDLRKGLNNITRKDWLAAAQRIGFEVFENEGRGSHAVVRKPDLSHDDPNSLVATLVKNMYRQASEKTFREFMRHGCSEDEIWKALGKL
jgi:hypothetical protein